VQAAEPFVVSEQALSQEPQCSGSVAVFTQPPAFSHHVCPLGQQRPFEHCLPSSQKVVAGSAQQCWRHAPPAQTAVASPSEVQVWKQSPQ
jgi:hypothetical protein